MRRKGLFKLTSILTVLAILCVITVSFLSMELTGLIIQVIRKKM